MLIILLALANLLWLENEADPQVQRWVEDRNSETQNFLSSLKGRDAIRKRLYELASPPVYNTVIGAGEYIIFGKQEGKENFPTYYIQKGLSRTPEILIQKEGINLLEPSKEGSHLVFAESQHGSDWCTLKVFDLQAKKLLPDCIEGVKIPHVAWRGQGFFYSRFPKTQEYCALNAHQKIYYHKLGDPQEKDALIWEDLEHPLHYFLPKTIADERFLVIIESKGTSGRQIWVKDLEQNTPFECLIKGFKHDPYVLTHTPKGFLVFTDEDAPNGKITLGNQTLIPEGPYPMVGVKVHKERIYITRLKNAASEVIIADFEGQILGEVPLPSAMGTFSGFKGEDSLFYGFESFNEATCLYHYDPSTNQSTLFKQGGKLPFEIEVNQVFYTSKDGTEIPLFLLQKKGLPKSRETPTLLYGYGGFGIPMVPHYYPFRGYLLERGALLAIPCIRGGGEYGKNWHEGGRLLNKQNSFDDFIAAADWLIQQGYTNSNKLAIEGASNGGLLVGACLTQRPDLFKVALPMVGVFDMLRFHLFTIGWGWVVEYGSPDVAKERDYLLSYSPLHNIKPSTSYPHTLIFTADHDDRVVPSHSYKFYSALKDAGAPAYLHITKNVGHGQATPLDIRINNYADLYAFLFYHLN